jgi:hypothetical protein
LAGNLNSHRKGKNFWKIKDDYGGKILQKKCVKRPTIILVLSLARAALLIQAIITFQKYQSTKTSSLKLDSTHIKLFTPKIGYSSLIPFT